jgi:hypothetical protein
MGDFFMPLFRKFIVIIYSKNKILKNNFHNTNKNAVMFFTFRPF